MGDPKKQRRKYQGPSHPWLAVRIESEKVLLQDYGLKNKKEIWKFESMLRRFKQQAKNLIFRKDKQAEIEKKNLLERLFNMGLLEKDAKMEDVLDIELKDLFERRLQTQVFKLGLTRSVGQARQFIVHGHIMIGEEKVDVPSYFVRRGEERSIRFSQSSKLNNAEHPERVVVAKEIGR